MMYIFDNVFSDDAYQQVADLVSKQEIKAGSVSTNPNLPMFKALPSEALLEKAEQILAYINALGLGTFETTMPPHLNVQPVGFDGAFHTDNDEFGTTHVAVFYCHHQAEWTNELGGYVLVGDPDTGDARAITPKCNRLIMHDASILHCALSPNSRAGTILRYSLAFKLKKTS